MLRVLQSSNTVLKLQLLWMVDVCAGEQSYKQSDKRTLHAVKRYGLSYKTMYLEQHDCSRPEA